MANILVMQMQDYQADTIRRDLLREGHNVSIYSNDIPLSKTLDSLSLRLKMDSCDIFFIDGVIAHNTRLRKSLNERGLNRLPLLVAYLAFEHEDDDLKVSGCDFGKFDIRSDTLPSDIARALIQSPIPRLDGVVYNPELWKEQNGVYVRR